MCVVVYSIPYYHRFSNFLVSFAQKRSHKDLKAMSKDISVIYGKFSREITFYCTQEITLLHTETLLLQSSRICMQLKSLNELYCKMGENGGDPNVA